MNNKRFTLGRLVVAVVLLVLVVLVGQQFLSNKGQRTTGSTISMGPFLQTATTSASQAITTSARIMATTTSITGPSYTRIFASICNPNANPVYLNMNGDKPAELSNTTAVIAAAAGYNACYEINDRNPYSGSVTASSTNQTSTTITVQQFVN